VSGPAAPAFNVLMAAYNAAETIDTSISSVLAQTRPDFELIVIDDGSADDTAERVRRFARSDRRVRLHRQRNRGLPAARNQAIALGDARYLTILDADDLLMPRYLEAVGAALEAHPHAGFAFPDAWGFDHAAQRFRRRTVMAHQGAPDPLPSDNETFLRALVRSNFVPIMFTIPRATIERVGGFHDSSRLAEDYEMLLRILGHGYPPIHVAATLGIYRRNRRGAITYDERSILSATREALRVFVADSLAPAEIKALAQERIDRFDQVLQAPPRAHGTPRRRWRAARRRLGAIKRAAIDRDGLLRRPPAEVRAAFPQFVRDGF
jgi:hypothetical protein